MQHQNAGIVSRFPLEALERKPVNFPFKLAWVCTQSTVLSGYIWLFDFHFTCLNRTDVLNRGFFDYCKLFHQDFMIILDQYKSA